MYTDLFKKAGLTPHQALLYNVLIEHGSLPASTVTKHTPLKRGLVYKVLDDLVEMELVRKKTQNVGGHDITFFAPSHPSKLGELIEQRRRDVEKASASVHEALGSLVSTYNLSLSMPGVQFFEGVEGMRDIYRDILRQGEDFYLIRSAYEPTYNDRILPIVKEFIRKRVASKIHVTALTPRDEFTRDTDDLAERDRGQLLTRTWVDKCAYDAPVEIDIYDDRVALLSFGTELVGTIIESPQIASALKQLFILASKGAEAESADHASGSR